MSEARQFLHHFRRSPDRRILSWNTDIARDSGIGAIAGLFIWIGIVAMFR
ncbi:hypothetical protein [Thermoleptolyngbya sp. C42_A2020_037]|nr:hypothetical protein [Thermoleptolyngbya sp. C42_A2020_037]MBF2087097.1 hypothetical protein [Thermoleptolyngbya sp. C42_A2020_037]